MDPLSISIVISPTGATAGRLWRTGAAISGDRVDLAGLDGRVLRLFERWLMDDRPWPEEDVRVFGQLLHRQLFSVKLWNWVEDAIAKRGSEVIRLQLAFPADAASSRLAALPWEFLCAPDRADRDGRFLVRTPGLTLSRSVPPGAPHRAGPESDEVRILPVVGRSDSDWLGEVDYRPVLTAIRTAARQPRFAACRAVVHATAEKTRRAVARTRPNVVHYVGHGRFDEATGVGAVALCAADGDTAWIDEDHLADLLCGDDWAPAVVVLHACEGGRNDFEYRHAGLAPGLVRHGVHCVVAMQYPVTNETAIAFSAALYRAIAKGRYLDEAVQSAREAIYHDSRDARLLGVPMIYQRDAAPLLGIPAPGGGGP